MLIGLLLFVTWAFGGPTAEETSVLNAVDIARQAGVHGRPLLCLHLTNAGMYAFNSSLIGELLPDLMRCVPDWEDVLRGDYPADNPLRGAKGGAKTR